MGSTMARAVSFLQCRSSAVISFFIHGWADEDHLSVAGLFAASGALFLVDDRHIYGVPSSWSARVSRPPARLSLKTTLFAGTPF